MKNKNILITGGTGLVGSHLIPLLEKEGFNTAILSRKKQPKTGVISFQWDVVNKKIDSKAIEWADIIIHLAGANVGEKRWTSKRKKTILESRTESTALLEEAIKSAGKTDLLFISASAIGIYENNTGKELDENGPNGGDFLAHVTKEWEKSIEKIRPLVKRLAYVRTGVVLSDQGGALVQMTTPVKFFVGAPLGSGKQIVSWIHMEDLCRIYLETIKNERLEGAINAVAPEAVSNKEITRGIADTINKPLWLPNVPGFVLKIILGEMSAVVLNSNHVIPKKLEDNDFSFSFPKVKGALEDLLSKKDSTK